LWFKLSVFFFFWLTSVCPFNAKTGMMMCCIKWPSIPHLILTV
jgi:hypothetical protein